MVGIGWIPKRDRRASVRLGFAVQDVAYKDVNLMVVHDRERSGDGHPQVEHPGRAPDFVLVVGLFPPESAGGCQAGLNLALCEECQGCRG